MDNNSKYTAAMKVIRSCKSVEQLDSCDNWVKELTFDSELDSYGLGYFINLKSEILMMRVYLDKLTNVENLNNTGVGDDGL
jgi:hypothetical protein